MILVGVTHDDNAEVGARLAEKVWNLRILAGERSCLRRTPHCSWSANSPSTPTRARAGARHGAPPRAREVSEPLVAAFVATLRLLGAEVATGVFGAEMQVHLVNDGPITLVLD